MRTTSDRPAPEDSLAAFFMHELVQLVYSVLIAVLPGGLLGMLVAGRTHNPADEGVVLIGSVLTTYLVAKAIDARNDARTLAHLREEVRALRRRI